MAVDILLSTYNGVKWIPEQMDSLLSQTYSNIKILIRDDGSSDGTCQLLMKWKNRYPDKITLLFEDNVGIIQSFNRLYTLSRSPFIAFCDQDDVWLSKKIEKGMALFTDSSGPLLVHSDLMVVDSEKRIMDPSFWHYSYLSGEERYAAFNRLLVQNVVTGCTTLFNRELADLAFPVPQDAIMHDWWFALVASCFGKIESIQNPLILYRQHAQNTIGAKPFSLFGSPKKNFKRLMVAARHEKQKILQAKSFFYRYQPLLPPSKKILLKDLMELKKVSYFKRVKTLLGHELYKIGWKRNFFHLLIKIKEG